MDGGRWRGDVAAQLVVGAPVALAVGRWRFGRLRRAGARPYALTGTLPRNLWQDGWRSGDLTDVVLAYGYPHAVSRPFTEVETCFAGSSSAAPSLEVAIARAEHRDESFGRWEWVDAGGPFDDDTPAAVPAGRHRRDQRMVSVDGVVTTVARLGFPGELAFAVVDDLESYFAGYRRLVRSFLVPWSK